MSRRNDGGPAFPNVSLYQEKDGSFASQVDSPGMTLRDYFIAHAPAEPQGWFEPEMPPKPVVPNWRHTEGDLRKNLEQWYDMGSLLTDEGRAWVVAHDELYKALNDWDRERRKQRYIQWPAAWADAMLAERERGQ